MGHDWDDFERRFDQRTKEFDRSLAKAKRNGKIIAAITLSLYLIGALLVLGLLAVALYGLARLTGLV